MRDGGREDLMQLHAIAIQRARARTLVHSHDLDL
jgi:hypothetical protein